MLKISHYVVGNICIVAVDGKLNHESYHRFDEYVVNLSEYNHIIIDCRELSYISSVGLQSLIILVKALNNKNGSLFLCEVNIWVKDVLDISGLNKFLPRCDNLQQALCVLTNERNCY